MSKHKRKTLAFLLRLTVVAVFSGAFVAGPHAPGRAEEESFPWCVQGGEPAMLLCDPRAMRIHRGLPRLLYRKSLCAAANLFAASAARLVR
jgi:hypothetical protein